MARPRNTPETPVSGQSNSSRQKGQFANRITFYDGYLDASDRQWIQDNWDAAPKLIFELINHAEEYGGLSCKFDERSGKWLAILFGGGTPETGAGFALTARASTATLALFVLGYKALHKFTQQWFAGTGSSDTLDFS